MEKTQWETKKMKEIFETAQKMKEGKIHVKSFSSIESFIKATKTQ